MRIRFGVVAIFVMGAAALLPACFENRSLANPLTGTDGSVDGGDDDEKEGGASGTSGAGSGGDSGFGGAGDSGSGGAGVSGTGTGSSGGDSGGRGAPGSNAGGTSGVSSAGMSGTGGAAGMSGAADGGGDSGTSGTGGGGDSGASGAAVSGTGGTSGAGGAGMGGGDPGTAGAGMGGAGGGTPEPCYALGPSQNTDFPAMPPPDAWVASGEVRSAEPLNVPHYICVGDLGPGKAIFGEIGAGCYMPGASGPVTQTANVRILVVRSASCLSWQGHDSGLSLPANTARVRDVAVCRVHVVNFRTGNVTSTGDHVGQVQELGATSICRYELYQQLFTSSDYEVLVTTQ